MCYLESEVITKYLNQPAVRTLLGVESPRNFSSCAADVGRAFNARMDKYTVPSQHYVAGLLERGVRVLIYSGTYDWQCNWVASRLWLEELEWTGAAAYRAQGFRDWVVGGHTAGQVKSAGLLTFATVFGAGHMMSVPAVILAAVGRVLTRFSASTFRWTSRRKHRPWCPGGWQRRRCELLCTYDANTISTRSKGSRWRPGISGTSDAIHCSWLLAEFGTIYLR